MHAINIAFQDWSSSVSSLWFDLFLDWVSISTRDVAPTPVSWLVGWMGHSFSEISDFHSFGVYGPLQSIRRPQDVICFPRATYDQQLSDFNCNTPPSAKLGLCRSTIYSKFFFQHQIFLWSPNGLHLYMGCLPSILMLSTGRNTINVGVLNGK